MTETIITSRFEDKYPLANIGYRILAFLVDFLIFWSIGMIIGMFFGTQQEETVGFSLEGLPALTLMIIGLFLWPISEGMFGQTIGKRFLNLKVLNDDFKPIGVGQAFGRFFLGFIDYIFIIGIIIASINKDNKRIGDMAASTIVVSLNKPKHHNS